MGDKGKKDSNFVKLVKAFGFGGFLHKYDSETIKKLKKAKLEGDCIAIAELHALDLTDEVIKRLDKIAALVEVGVIREDLLLELHAMITRDRKDIHILEDFKESLSLKQYEALLLSNTIIQLEDKTFSDRAQKLQTQLERRYPSIGKKIYNWHRSEYIRDYFHYHLCYEKYQSPNRYAEKFSMLFNKHLDYFEHAVWTNNKMEDDGIEKEISKRLKKSPSKGVKVYARGDFLIGRVLKICEKFVSSNPKYGIFEKKEYPLGENMCISLIITEVNFLCKK